MKTKWKARKIVIIFLILLISLCGCTKIETARPDVEHEDSGRFIAIDRGFSYTVIVDKETGVEYFWANHGGVTPLFDENGNFLIWEEGG